MTSRTAGLLVAVATLALGTSLRALDVFNHSATVNERFLSGTFPSSPATNTGSFLSGYDLSGIGWQAGSTSFAVTLVSPQNFLAAAHAAPAASSSVSFLGADGTVRSYTVGAVTPIYYSAGVASDLVVGTLTAAVNPQITYYGTLFLGSNLSSYTGLNLAVYGAGGTIGLNSISSFATADFSPVNGVADNLFAVMNYDSVSGGTLTAPAATQGQGGDSSSPSFVRVGSNLAIVGVHSAINGSPPPYQTYDAFVPAYLNDINAVLQGNGYSLGVYTAVPEPASYALGLGLAGVVTAFALRRRKR